MAREAAYGGGAYSGEAGGTGGAGRAGGAGEAAYGDYGGADYEMK